MLQNLGVRPENMRVSDLATLPKRVHDDDVMVSRLGRTRGYKTKQNNGGEGSSANKGRIRQKVSSYYRCSEKIIYFANINFAAPLYLCSVKQKNMCNMKMENDIRVNMIRMVENFVPFVKVDFLDKDAKECSGLMIVDSGTNDSMLAGEIAEIGVVTKVDDKVNRVRTFSGNEVETSKVQFSFVLGNQQICEGFDICNDFHVFNHGGMNIIGIIGTSLLCKYGLVIDYSEGSLHSSTVNPSNLAISDCDYFFPLEMGLKYYRLPVVAIRQNNTELVMLADTGATGNVIAHQSLKDNGFSHSFLDSKEVVNGLAGGMEVDQATVDFNLLTLDGSKEVVEVSHQDRFMVTPRYVIPSDKAGCFENGELLPPVEGLISSDFMAKQGWSLDFGARIIYKRKAA